MAASLALVGGGSAMALFGTYWSGFHPSSVADKDAVPAKQTQTLTAYTQAGAGFVTGGLIACGLGTKIGAHTRTTYWAALAVSAMVLAVGGYLFMSQYTDEPETTDQRIDNARNMSGSYLMPIGALAGGAIFWINR